MFNFFYIKQCVSLIERVKGEKTIGKKKVNKFPL